jgi:chemotaxis protein methyltransferase CheR
VANESCTEFLRWALPSIGLRWAGFRRVRRQVCKRIGQRLRELTLGDCATYRRYLADHPAEWAVLASLCRIPISRFARDAPVFSGLERDLLPRLVADALGRGSHCLRVWSAGCAAGEEPYFINLVWRFSAAASCPRCDLEILASDADAHQLERARIGCYRTSSLKEVPLRWREEAFFPSGRLRCLKPEFRQSVKFERQDIRESMPPGPFDVILCRNLVFTYFAEDEQSAVLDRLIDRLVPGGALVIGVREKLPRATPRLIPWDPVPGTFRKAGA